MPIDSIFIKHLAKELNDELATSKVKKIYDINNNDILIKFSNKKNLVLTNNCVYLKETEIATPSTPANITMQLRKYLDNFTLEYIDVVDTERIIKFHFIGLNELKDKVSFILYYELLGRISNFILVDEQNHIQVVKHRLNNELRTILPNFKYELPTHDNSYFLNTSNYDNCYGTSQKIINYYIEHGNNFINDFNPTVSTNDIYFTNIFEGESFPTLSTALEYYYSRNLTKHEDYNLKQIIEKQIKKELKKQSKLAVDIKKAFKHQIYKVYGDLILTYGFNNKDNPLEVTDFEGNNHTIYLKEDLSPSDNANYYYKLYQKSKKALIHLEEQINLSKQREEQLLYLEYQIDTATGENLKPIFNELVDLNIIKAKKLKLSKNNLNKIVVDDVEIVWGQNSLQNETITFSSNRNFYWFHAKDCPGSHVVLKTDQPTTIQLEIAAEIAAYHSKLKDESKVRVIKTQLKYIKKDKSALGSVKVTKEDIMLVVPNKH